MLSGDASGASIGAKHLLFSRRGAPARHCMTDKSVRPTGTKSRSLRSSWTHLGMTCLTRSPWRHNLCAHPSSPHRDVWLGLGRAFLALRLAARTVGAILVAVV